MTDTIPSTGNYTISKGVFHFTPEGQGAVKRHMGNCEKAQLKLAVQALDHNSQMHGVKSKDFTAIVGKSGTITMTLDELAMANIKLAVLGTTNSENEIELLGATGLVYGKLEFTGTNDVGKQISMELPRVAFSPAKVIDLITDSWNQIELEAEILLSGGTFGKIWENAHTTEGA